MSEASGSYFSEFRQNIRSLAAASLGVGFGLGLMSYMTTLFGPYLVKAFGWSKSQYALIALAMIPALLVLPYIGRLTDRIGVRRSALIGVLAIPASLLGYSLMHGQFAVYFALSTSILVFGSFTSAVVYTRLIAVRFERARGLALTIVTVSPALIGVIAVPLLTKVIALWDWRMGYRVLALFMLIGGLAALALVPPGEMLSRGKQEQQGKADYRAVLTSAPFWIILSAMFLCTLATPLHASQMGLMLTDKGLNAAGMARVIPIYIAGTVLGRITCGLALDRFPAPYVAALSMALPALGFAMLAAPAGFQASTAAAMFLVGMAVGSETDLQSYLVARHFPVSIYSTTLGLVLAGVFAAGALGAIGLSMVLKATDSFTPFLAAMAVASGAGALLFLLLPKSVKI